MTTEAQRIEIIALSNQGLTAPEVAEKVGCSVWTVRKWKQVFKKKHHCNLQWDALSLAACQVFHP